MQEPKPPVTPSQSILFAAPHRAMFLSGVVMLLLSFSLWTLEIAVRAGVMAPIAWTLPPGWMHSLLVLCGVFPLFMFGFLLTAMPRWQGAGDLSPEVWLWPWRLLALGWGVALTGLWVPGMLAGGLLLVFVGWAGIIRVLHRIAFNDHADATHARVVWAAVTAGALALAAWIGFVLSGEGGWARVAINVGVWWFMLPVFFTVCHRMVPFFSSNIIPAYVMVRPKWALAVVIGASVAHGVLAMLDLKAFTWIVDLPAAGTALWLSWRWRLIPSLRVPLLGMLHIGFAWLGVALALSSVQGLAALAGHSWFGLAPLHVLGVGFFGSVLLGMVSRVTLGHSGQKLAADKLTWAVFIGLEAVVVLRVLAEWAPAAWAAGLMLAAVMGWMLVFGIWAARYLPIYLRPRSDGRAG